MKETFMCLLWHPLVSYWEYKIIPLFSLSIGSPVLLILKAVLSSLLEWGVNGCQCKISSIGEALQAHYRAHLHNGCIDTCLSPLQAGFRGCWMESWAEMGSWAWLFRVDDFPDETALQWGREDWTVLGKSHQLLCGDNSWSPESVWFIFFHSSWLKEEL